MPSRMPSDTAEEPTEIRILCALEEIRAVETIQKLEARSRNAFARTEHALEEFPAGLLRIFRAEASLDFLAEPRLFARERHKAGVVGALLGSAVDRGAKDLLPKLGAVAAQEL